MATKNYVGVAPLTMVNVGPGGYAYVYADMPVPEGASAEELKRLTDEGFIAEKKAAEKKSDDGPAPGTIDFILAEVGDDKEKAAAALEEEKAGQNRSTLVKKLEAIANPS